MNVLSLFDGIAGARLAIRRCGLSCNYYSSEIDKYAMFISNRNFPDIVRLGNIIDYNNWDIPSDIDLIIGGSPCQGFSSSGKHKNFDDERSRLFYFYVDILEKYDPKFFILENVKMKQEYKNIISSYLGVSPIEINSSLVSAQDRKRLYWTNINCKSKLIDKGIVVQDILESGYSNRDKSYTIDANYYKGGSLKNLLYKLSNNQPLSQSERRLSVIDDNLYRKFTPIECERLQTYPDNYTFGISNTQRYKVLGNSFTVDVISYILSNI